MRILQYILYNKAKVLFGMLTLYYIICCYGYGCCVNERICKFILHVSRMNPYMNMTIIMERNGLCLLLK